MMKPEHRIESSNWHKGHVAIPKGAVDSIMDRLQVANASSGALVTELCVTLILDEQVVKLALITIELLLKRLFHSSIVTSCSGI